MKDTLKRLEFKLEELRVRRLDAVNNNPKLVEPKTKEYKELCDEYWKVYYAVETLKRAMNKISKVNYNF